MTAQFLYDLREATGFVSGTHLHKLFAALVDDPSPSGRVEIDIKQATQLCPELKAEMCSREWGAHAKAYCGVYGGNTPLFMYEPQEAQKLLAQIVEDAQEAAFDAPRRRPQRPTN